jgi:mannose-1-phosphate guanylyltransferase
MLNAFQKKNGGSTVKRFNSVQVVAVILMVFTVSFMYPQASLAHAPQDVKLVYDSQSQMLTVTITHKSPFPNYHYINSVEIKKNGNIQSTNKYKNQPDQATFAYSYKVPAAAGETLEVTASCSLFGSRTANLTVGK